jgi:outer membrane scaffolding protein for murein synthesis (MipA/OmpV family)
VVLAILAAGGLPMASASAQTTGTMTKSYGEGRVETESSDSKWAVGFAGGMNYRVYRYFDDKVRGFPTVTYEGEYVHVFGSGVDVKLPSVGPVTFRLRGKYISEGYESGDSPFLRDMSDRDSSFWVGGVATWRTDLVRLSAEVLTDAMSNSKGSRAKLQIDRRFAAAAFGFTPRLATEWVDSNYVDYYYGVMASEVIAGRPGYQGAPQLIPRQVYVLIGARLLITPCSLTWAPPEWEGRSKIVHWLKRTPSTVSDSAIFIASDLSEITQGGWSGSRSENSELGHRPKRF